LNKTKFVFAKIDKRKLRPLFLKVRKELESNRIKYTPTEIARIVLAVNWSGKKKRMMSTETLEELLYLIEVMEERK